MINSIQQFQENGVKNLTEIFSHYTDDLTKFAEMGGHKAWAFYD